MNEKKLCTYFGCTGCMVNKWYESMFFTYLCTDWIFRYMKYTKVFTDIYVQVEWYMNDERVEENISAGIIITDSSLVIQVRSVEWQNRERACAFFLLGLCLRVIEIHIFSLF